jgi:FlaA1/EpsC-like NDP-sugar epimerase
MGGLLPTTPPRHRRSTPIWRRVPAGAVIYGPGFTAQVLLFYAVLVIGQIVATGRTGSVRQLELGLGLVVVALGAAEAHLRLYRRVWAVAGLADAIALALAVIEATSLITLANILIPPVSRPFPSAIPVLVSPIVLSVISTFRFLPRIVRRRTVAENRLLVVVPDSSAYGTVKSLIQSSSTMWSVIAIVSVTPLDARQTLMGIPILGDTADLEHWIGITNAEGVAFVHGDIPHRDFRNLFATCLKLEKPIFIIPSPEELFRSPGFSRLRQLSADDLIATSSAELKLDDAATAINGKTVLVTGAAGSVGSELCRTLATLHPGRLVLVDNNESGLFDIAAQVRTISSADVKESLVSIEDRELLLNVFSEERPEIVFHAAAYKHVPMLESHPEQAFKVNVLGTKNALWCSEAVSTRDFILISTDKAASTESVMGCTKRLCELMVLTHRGSMRCRAVRFGNVVGSRGSVIPIFERQIQQGGPVTITHPEMTRYMMTSRQAAALVISTVLLAPQNLYMLDMGEPIKIQDIANALIRARGLRPGKDIDVVVTGVRHGERLSENLLGPEEFWRSTTQPSIRQVLTPMPQAIADLEWTLEHLSELARQQQSSELTRALKQAVWSRPTPAAEVHDVPATGREVSKQPYP